MRIVVVNGSLKRQSNTMRGIQVVLKALEKKGVQVECFSLRDYPLPMYDPEQSDTIEDEHLERFIQLMREADGYILGSPEYHGTISGVLKNALDWIGARELKDKPVALVASAGGPAAVNTLNTLQTVVRTLHGWTIPIMGTFSKNEPMATEGSFANPKLNERFQKIASELVVTATLLKRKRMESEQIIP